MPRIVWYSETIDDIEINDLINVNKFSFKYFRTMITLMAICLMLIYYLKSALKIFH